MSNNKLVEAKPTPTPIHQVPALPRAPTVTAGIAALLIAAGLAPPRALSAAGLGSPTGACCFGVECIELGPDACKGEGGKFQGEGTECHPDACAEPPTGGCCLGDDCLQLTGKHCVAEGGKFLGDGTECHPDACPGPPTGACCFERNCMLLTAEHCQAEGGEHLGADSECSEHTCDANAAGACCLGDGCVDVPPEACAAEGGVFHGPDTCAQIGAICTPGQTLLTCDLPLAVALPGGGVDVDVYVEQVTDLRGYQVAISVSLTSGVGQTSCAAIEVDETRDNYVFLGAGGTFTVTDCSDLNLAASLISGGVSVGASRRYLGTFTLQVSADAQIGSTFDINVLPEPDTLLGDLSSAVIPFAVGATCALRIDDCQPLPHGDATRDGVVDIFDILCVLDGFADIFDDCLLEDVDVDPCGGDGQVNLFDIFAILDAFQELPNNCEGRCIPPSSAADAPSRRPRRRTR